MLFEVCFELLELHVDGNTTLPSFLRGLGTPTKAVAVARDEYRRLLSAVEMIRMVSESK